jgi:hypothetical protein
VQGAFRLYFMTDFIAYPGSVDELFSYDIFLKVIDKARTRLRARIAIDFCVAPDDRLLLAHAYWCEASDQRWPSGRAREWVPPNEAVAVQLFVFRRVLEHLCSLMCSARIVDEARLMTEATRTQAERYQLIREVPTEYFSLNVTYKAYVHFAAREKRTVTPDRLDRLDFFKIIELCHQLRNTPSRAEGAFEQIGS